MSCLINGQRGVLAVSGCIQWRRVLKVPLLGMLIQAWLWITLLQIWLRGLRCFTPLMQCRHSWPSLLQYWGVNFRGTSHLIFRACDLWSLESLIGGKGGDCPISFSSRAWGPTAPRKLWMEGRPTWSPTWHEMIDVSWSTRFCDKSTSKDAGLTQNRETVHFQNHRGLSFSTT